MSLAESHSNSSLEKRKPKRHSIGENNIQYAKADEVVSLIVCDIANGVSRSDCIEKVRLGMYDNRPLGQRQAEYYYKAALDRIREDRQQEVERLKDLLYTRYESLYADSVKANDRSTAKGVLDSIAKLFVGINEKNTNIQINSQDNQMVIKFGFNDQKDDE